MTTTKEPETAVATAANGSADAVKAAAHAGEGDGDQELDPASEEPEEIPIRVDPLQQQNASPVDIDKGLRLIQLCRDGSLLAVKSHISEGSPAGFISKTGWTPLAAAAYSGKADIVSYLLEIGADMMYTTSRRNNNSSSALGDSSLLHSSSSTSSAGSVKASTDSSHYGHTNSRPSCGVNTPLHWASYKGHLDVLSILLHAGYSIEDVDPIGNRCLHLACSSGHRDVVELLLANSASVDQKNQYGNRPLDLATDPNCRKLLLKFQSQSTCEWCKEAFSRIRRPSLCQHCHNIYCDARPCSSYSEAMVSSSSSGNGTTTGVVRALRYCQECANEMGKAEQDLRGLLESKLELIRHTLGLIGNESDVTLSASSGRAESASRSASGATSPDAEGNTSAEGDAPSAEADTDAAADTEADEDASASEASPNGANGEDGSSGVTEGGEPIATARSDESSTSSLETVNTAGAKTSRKRMISNEEMARALNLSQTDAEALYTAIEAAQAKAADQELIQHAKRTYHQLVAHVALQEEIKSLMVVRPIGIRSLVEPLKSALQLAQREKVSDTMLQLAIQVIQSAEAECTLFGCNTLCEKIELGSKKHSRDIARLEASIGEAQVLGVNDKLLASAVALRDRLNAEIMLEDCLLPFTPKSSVSSETGVEIAQYLFSDGSMVFSLLQALELRSQKITAAVEFGSSVEGVSSALLEEGANILKQLKKDVREEMKNEEERRRLEEEAALKAAKKGKKKKA